MENAAAGRRGSRVDVFTFPLQLDYLLQQTFGGRLQAEKGHFSTGILDMIERTCSRPLQSGVKSIPSSTFWTMAESPEPPGWPSTSVRVRVSKSPSPCPENSIFGLYFPKGLPEDGPSSTTSSQNKKSAMAVEAMVVEAVELAAVEAMVAEAVELAAVEAMVRRRQRRP
jgi:hypothetical protein